MPAILKTVFKYACLFGAACIIFAATLVCASRLLTPVLEQHRSEFETLASQFLHTPVSIANVRASWYGYQPEISLQGVTVFDNDHKPVMQIREVDVFLSLPQSLWQRHFVPGGVMIAGTSLNINSDKDGNVSVQGFPQFGNETLPYTNQTKLTDVLAWLGQEQRIILRNIDLHYSGFNHVTRYVTLHNLSLSNSGTNHTITGTATLNQKLPTKLSLAVEVQGDNLDLKQDSAKGYISFSGLDLSQWLKGTSWHNWEIKKGITSNKIWFDYHDQALQKVQVVLQAYGIQLHSQTDNSLHAITRLSGNFGWKREDGNDIFAGDDVLIDLPNHLWPVSNFYLTTKADQNGELIPQTLTLGYINLADISSFINSSSELSEDQLTIFKDLALAGNLQNTKIQFNADQPNILKAGLTTTFDHLSFNQSKSHPGMTNLAGNLQWDGSQGTLNLDSNQTQLADNALFKSTLPLDQVHGQIQLQRSDDDIWKFNTTKLSVTNNEFNTTLNGNLIVPANNPAIINMTADFALQQVEHVATYLPLKLFSNDLATWIDKAFISGSASSGHAEVRGALNDFPFESGNGVFQVTTHVANTTLNYAPNWPLIKNIDADITFSGRSMKVNASNAQINDIPLGQVQAQIPYIGPAKTNVLTAEGDRIATSFEQARNFVQQSPLESTLGKMLTAITLKGPTNIKVGLKIPLDAPDKTSVSGQIAMQNSLANLGTWGLNLTDLNGTVNFTQNSLSASELKAKLFDKPIQFNLQTLTDKADSVIKATFESQLDIDDIKNWLQLPLDKFASGTTNVNGTVNLSMTQPLSLELNSDLQGVAVNLPENYGKQSKDTREFNMELSAPDKQPLKIKLNYANQLSAAALITSQNQHYQLTAADVHLGAGAAEWPDSQGLYITGNFNTLDWATIQRYVNSSSDNKFDTSSFNLQGIDLQAKHLLINGLDLANMAIQVTPEKKAYIIGLESPDISGQVQIPKEFNANESLVAFFTRLNLPAIKTTGMSQTVNVKDLPSIIFTSKSTTYDHKALGQISLKTTPSSTGLKIQNLQVVSRNINLKAVGQWTQNGTSSSTQVQGVAVSKKVDGLLKSLGFDAHNIVMNDGQVNFNLGWKDAPYAFALNNLNGNVSLALGKGRIIDIGQESGAKMDFARMLSIFSLQTIPRRLSLDFSDVFEKGYSFDTLKGDLNLRNGNVYTHNFKFNGPVAMVGINGRIGLVNKDYDFTLVVTPYVTSSIPAAAVGAALLGQPLIGLAAFAVNNVIGPTLISKATTYYYAVSGPWAAPVWKTISSSKVLGA